MTDSLGVYEVRYAWNRQLTNLFFVLALFAGLMIWAGEPLWSQALIFAVLVIGVITTALPCWLHEVAVRVDEEGVSFGSVPILGRSSAQHFPWSDVEELRLWHVQVGLARIPYLGVVRRTNAPAITGGFGKWNARLGAALVRGATSDLVQASRTIKFLPLDVEAMTQAVAQFAPDVAITPDISNRRIAECIHIGARQWSVLSLRRTVIRLRIWSALGATTLMGIGVARLASAGEPHGLAEVIGGGVLALFSIVGYLDGRGRR